MTLNVAIATLGAEGISRLAAAELPRVDGVGYVVSWQSQGHTAIPPELKRDDVEIHILEGKGVSRNRNNAITRCTADIILNGDDDLIYSATALREIMRIYETEPGLDFATFRHEGPDRKPYPAARASLAKMPKGYSVATFELSFRRRIVDEGLRFDERFGPGCPLAAGEDEMMLLSLRRLGYNGAFFPLTIATHPTLTTGFRAIANPDVARAMGAVIGFSHPYTSLLRLPLKALRMHRSRQLSAARSIVPLFDGWMRHIFMRAPWKK